MELTPWFWYCFFQVILDNMIDNGSFEVLTIDFESLTSSILQSPSTALKNWVVNSGNVKFLRGSRFQSSDNSSSVLDMNGNTGGSIITYFGTTPKSTYAILLDIATNPDIAETDKQGIPEQCSTKLEVTVKVQATGKTLLTDLVTVSSYMLPQVSSQSQTKENPSQMSILLCTWKILMHCASSQMWLVCASELFIDVILMCHMHFFTDVNLMCIFGNACLICLRNFRILVEFLYTMVQTWVWTQDLLHWNIWNSWGAHLIGMQKYLFLVLGFAVEAKEGITIKCGEMGDGWIEVWCRNVH